jgi:poly(A) polymerase
VIAIDASQAPIGKLDPEPWITAPETIAVMSALSSDGTDARFVGGCVRDAIAKRVVKDVDIATPDTPDRVSAKLNDKGIRTIPTGLDHGTVTAVVGERTFEITTLREDVEPLGRRAVVAFTDNWIIDSARRDFTINAMSANARRRCL